MSRRWAWIPVLVVVVWAAYWLLAASGTREPAAAEPGARPVNQGVPVVAQAARQGDQPVYLSGLGSVTAFNTVTVKSRVDGQLVKVAFEEGQLVHEGDPLAEIDPRPFEVQLTQAEGQMARDQAQLKDAKLTLARFHELFTQGVISKQELDNQEAQAGQYEGAVKADQGLIDNAKLQLAYCHVTAPISGRTGLRLLDVGNMVHANDQNGLVVITQLRPIAVLFAMPEDSLPAVMRKLNAGERLRVEAYDRAGRNQIATGSLLTVDNQIDETTGTTRFKAIFDNQDDALFPKQFVNVRLLLETKKDAIVVPAAAIQRGPQGTFVYVVKPDETVEVRPVAIGPTTGADVSVETGLAANEVVVVDGVDKLRAGSRVQVRVPSGDTSGQRPNA
jgi:multidrug efflux system membrane fusion protein